MRVVNLSSGSKGNCTLIQTKETIILLDIGLGIKELLKRLEFINISPEKIDAIVITHEHNDHIKGLSSFIRKYKKPVYVHEDVWPYIEYNIGDVSNSCERKFNSLPFVIGNVKISPFCVSHDSKNCQGFCFECGNAKFSYATDLGYVSGEVFANLLGSKLIFIESNHDIEMLKNSTYPLALKARIRGNTGHLSNVQCAETVANLAKHGTRYFGLCHLSQNNNTPELAFNTVANVLVNNGFNIEKDVFIRLTYPDKVGNNFNLKED